MRLVPSPAVLRRLSPSFAVVLLLAVTPGANDGPILGFTAEHAKRQREIEQRLDGLIDASEQEAWNRRMSSAPNHVGAPHNR